MTNEEFSKNLDKAYAYIRDILIEKNKSYGSSAFEGEGVFPILGNYIRLSDKLNRYKNLLSKLIEKGGDIESLRNNPEFNPFNESLWDTVCDTLGYSLIGLIILDSKGLGKLSSKEDNIAEIPKKDFDRLMEQLEEVLKEKESPWSNIVPCSDIDLNLRA